MRVDRDRVLTDRKSMREIGRKRERERGGGEERERRAGGRSVGFRCGVGGGVGAWGWGAGWADLGGVNPGG